MIIDLATTEFDAVNLKNDAKKLFLILLFFHILITLLVSTIFYFFSIIFSTLSWSAYNCLIEKENQREKTRKEKEDREEAWSFLRLISSWALIIKEKKKKEKA